MFAYYWAVVNQPILESISQRFNRGEMLVNLRSLAPRSLCGPILVDDVGLPRFWAAVWASFLPADLAPATIAKKLNHLDGFYQHADSLLGPGTLDNALADLDVDALGDALEGYFFSLRNSSSVTPASEERWQAAIQFVREIAQRLDRNSRANDLHERFARLESLHSSLHVGRRSRAERVRALPAEVVEYLYELLDPESKINPFQNAASRWRTYVLFIFMLHQGLRRGELLAMPVDVIKSGFDRGLGKERYWMNVAYNEYEDDPRYSKPGIKNAPSVRELPVSITIALVGQEYALNYRGRADHSFFLNSQKGNPLSTERVTKIFQEVTASLPQSLQKSLHDHTGESSISPHDLRHTCAVMRLNRYLTEGVSMDDALQQMRVFFGWSRKSDMPLRYARTVFEDRLASVWKDEFDERVSVLRSLPGRAR
jgi:integrase